MALSLGPLQTAIYNKLVTANVAGGRIFDDVATGYATFPYVEIGEWLGNEADVSLADGHDAILTLRVWARSGGQKGLHDVFQTVLTALHAQSLAATGYSTAHSLVIGMRTLKMPDGVTYQGTALVNILAWA